MSSAGRKSRRGPSSSQAGADELLRRLVATSQGQADPYPVYRKLLELAPLHRSALDGAWYSCRFEDCRRLLGDPRCGISPDAGARSAPASNAGEEQGRSTGGRLRQSMVMQNPPEHTRLRRAVSWAFTPGRAEGLRPRIQKLADRVLDGMAAKGDVDVMAELAFPLPVAVIGEVLGVPPDETEQFRDLTEAGNVGAIDQAMRADAKLETYFLDLIARRRARPSEDLLGSLVGGPLSDEELLATAILLFIAGFITTTNLIGNGLLALLSHPDEMGRLGQDRGLLPLAVDEMIRYDGPVQVVARTVFEPLEILGRTLDAGDRVVAVLGAANRDPDRFEDPDRFDVRRAGNGPLGFGWGVHRCLGAPLARLEAEMVFGSLLERFSSIELLDANPPRRPGLMIRGLAALPVRVTPR